jgi:DNA replication and repair protein RecF
VHVGDLTLEDFRNYVKETVDLAPGLNLVVGRNAQGKTNLLEAVYCLGGLGSPRAPDSALVREGCDRALLHADVTRGSRTVPVDMEFRPGRGTRALINKTAVPSVRALGELAVSVFFGPDELSLVKGSPDGRRRFLDDLIVKLRPAQYELRREWDRVLKQRNALLKTFPRHAPASAHATLEVWDEQFCRAGAALAAARLDALGRLIPFARSRYEEIAGGGNLDLGYVSSWCSEDESRASLDEPAAIDQGRLTAALQARLDEVKPRELERGISLAGPGRDDVFVKLQTPGGPHLLDARTHASQGDQRTSALALKLGEHDLLTDSLGDHPILLLDDVFSELDPQRRGWLREAVRGTGQTLLSSADTDTWGAVGAERTFEVSQGAVMLLKSASEGANG